MDRHTHTHTHTYTEYYSSVFLLNLKENVHNATIHFVTVLIIYNYLIIFVFIFLCTNYNFIVPK
jgi:hypothetical protein